MESGIRSTFQGDEAVAVGQRRLVPMRVGTATVYVEQVGDPAVVYDDGSGIKPVAPPDLAAAFTRAGQAIQECVQTIGSRVEALAGKAKPQEIVVEFSLTFEAQGGVHLLPVFVTAQSKIGTGLKVTATWSLADADKPEGD